MTPHFYLQDAKSKRPTTIFFVCIIKGVRIKHTTGLKVHPVGWNSKLERVKPMHPGANQINLFLSDISNRAEIVRMEFITSYRQITKEAFINKVFKIPEKIDFKVIIPRFLEDKSKLITPGTLKHYQTSWSALVQFFGKTKPEIGLYGDQVMDRFADYLLKEGKSPNYVIKIISRVLEITAYAGMNVPKPKRIKSAKSDSVALSLEEVRQISVQSLPEHLARIRDLFTFQCLTGLRYSDLKAFKPDQIQLISGVKCLVIYSQKTKAKSVIPLFSDALKVLGSDNSLPKVLTSQKYNEGIKEVCMLSGLTHSIQLNKHLGRTTKIIKLPKYQAISSHSARRTYVTIMSNLGLTPKEIGLMTGHSQTRIVEIYDKSKAEENAVKVAGMLKDRL